MANEDNKGYSVSDGQAFDSERSDAHQSTLNASNPVLANLRRMGISGELPKQEVTEEAKTPTPTSSPADTLSSDKMDVDDSATQSPPDAEQSQLSPFTQWLKGLKKPEVHRSEQIDTATPPRQEVKTAAQQEIKPAARPEVKPTDDSGPEPETNASSTDDTHAQVEKQKQVIEAAKKDTEKKKKKKKKKKRKKLADDGSAIVLSDEVYSETLAELLESQGHYAEALAMYDKLRLKYPEKSRFFAAKIEKLHKKA